MASLISFSLPKPTIIRATSSSLTKPSPSIPTTTSTPEALQEKFGRKGIKFLESNNIPVVELTVRNGSTLRLQIPDAHITSYKPKVYWRDDGFYELLYTVPEDGKESSKVKGGIGLVVNDVTDAGTKGSKGSLINTSEWTVKDVDSDAIDAVQAELCCTNGPLYMRYVVSLYPDTIAAAFIMKNNGKKEMTLKSAILSHLRLKKRGKSAIQGLKGCSYCALPPLSSPFEILSPSEAMKMESPGLFDFGVGAEPDDKPGSWGAQDVPFTILKRKISRVYGAQPQERLKPVYNTTPSKYEMLDQGHELFFRVIRIGFQDIYIGSPGSLAEKYGKEYFICTGPAAILVPVTLKPGQEWRGAQVIEHDNLS